MKKLKRAKKKRDDFFFLSFFFLKEEEAKSHCASRESTVVLFSCVWILLFFPSFSTSMRFLWYLFRFTSLRRAQRSKKEKRKKSGVVVVVAGSYLMGRPTGRASCLIEFSLLRLLRRLRSSAAPLSPLLFLYTIYYPWRGFSGADEEEIKRRGEKEGRKKKKTADRLRCRQGQPNQPAHTWEEIRETTRRRACRFRGKSTTI